MLVAYSFDGLECTVLVAYFVFLRDVWNRTQRDAAASRRANNLATHLPNLSTHPPQTWQPISLELSHPSPSNLAIQLPQTQLPISL